MYDACVSFYNEEFRSKPTEKALYASANGGCWGAWGMSSLDGAHQRAFDLCKEKSGEFVFCGVFADSTGLAVWAQEVSANGGIDPTQGQGAVTNAASTSGGNASCTPVPPDCQRANDRGEAMIASFPATTGIYDSASQAYCSYLVGIGVNDHCAMNYRAIGKSNCAAQLEAQSREYQSALYQVEATINTSSLYGIRQACTWE